jgi:flagellar assembly protein FliH
VVKLAKDVFKAVEITSLDTPQIIEAPDITRGEEEEEVKKEEYSGPTIEEVEEEIYRQRQEFEEEIKKRREEVEEECDRIKKEAEEWAFNKVQEASQEYDTKINQSEEESNNIISNAKNQADMIISDAKNQAAEVMEDARNKGEEDGWEEGFSRGEEEVNRLITRLNRILSSTIQKRNEVLEEAESQIVDIIIAVARKVVKTITESHKNIVIEQISEAIQKLKGRAEITIRVNVEDLMMTTKHKKDFIQMVEGIENVKILEDNSVDKGGCIITTDFGSVDARISSQLSELEQKIKEIAPFEEEL